MHTDGSIESPPPNLSLTWLFNITADPNERDNVAVKHPIPDVVKQQIERIELYKRNTHQAVGTIT